MSPFEVNRAWYLPKELNEADVERMRSAAKQFLGTQDFTSYMAQGSKIVDPIRTVTRSELTKEGDLILYRIAADGFLYHMVRIIVGTLVEVALGRLDPSEIPEITNSRNRERAGLTAPACGLYLNRVFYSSQKINRQSFDKPSIP